MEPISRRQFFTTAATVSGTALVLAACGDDSQSSSKSTGFPSRTPAHTVVGLISSDLYASPNPQRVAFAIAQGTSFVDAGDVTVTFTDDAGAVVATSTASYHDQGLPKDRGIYVCEATLPTTGILLMSVAVKTGVTPQDSQISVTPVSAALPIGLAAPKEASPTPTATLGVDPICTRSPAL